MFSEANNIDNLKSDERLTYLRGLYLSLRSPYERERERDRDREKKDVNVLRNDRRLAERNVRLQGPSMLYTFVQFIIMKTFWGFG